VGSAGRDSPANEAWPKQGGGHETLCHHDARGILLGAVPVARAANPPNCPATGTTGGNCNCVNTIISSATIGGNVVVPAGDFCFLGSGVTVSGNVTVDSGATLNIEPTPSQVTIGGNILAATSPGCSSVTIPPDPPPWSLTIGGNVKIEGCARNSGYATTGTSTVKIDGNFTCNDNAGVCIAIGGSVGGNVTVDDNPGGAAVEGNTVGGNVEADGNGPGSTTVTSNTIGGNLTCTGDTPPPVASGNTVHGTTNCP
jgi:hypothetical protein